MERARIVVAVKANIESCTGIKDVDPAKSLKDYGVSSLDMVEIVSKTMRELKVKVPRSQLMKAKTLDGLIDIIRESALAAAKPL